MNAHRQTILIVCIFSIAMAILESATVVYLRALYYPDGFSVALKIMDQRIMLTELVREAATVVMLISIGLLAGKNGKDRFAYFLISFAVWDIFYYVGLKVFIDWPSSLLEWDILFLIPFTWLGPVLAPIICSITMLVWAFVILRSNKPIARLVMLLILAGSAVVLYTFLRDYASILYSNGFFQNYSTLMQNKKFLDIASGYVPADYSWGIFVAGELLIVVGIIVDLAEVSRRFKKI